MSDRFDHLEDSEREWLRASRRSAARRSWLLIGVLVVAAIVLAWLTVDGLPWGNRSGPTTTSTAFSAVKYCRDQCASAAASIRSRPHSG